MIQKNINEKTPAKMFSNSITIHKSRDDKKNA